MPTPRSIEQIVEEEGRRWHPDRTWWTPGRVITVSREPGARGGEVARAVAHRLGLAFYDRELLTRIAAEAHVAERAVPRLDERERVGDWLAPVARMEHLSPYQYAHHLGRVVHAIATAGDAVILGRGAHLLVPPGGALRVLVQAPWAMRIATVAAREGIGQGAARDWVAEMERERQSFLARCFHSAQEDPARFDLRVNTGVLGVDAAIAIVCAAAGAMGVAPGATARRIA